MITILSPNMHSGRLKAIRVIVIHTMEVNEDDRGVAESVGRAFANRSRQASAHIGVDRDSEVRYVPDGDTAWAAPGANADGLQIELAGRAGQTTGDWTDPASKAILERAAQQVAAWCRIYGIPTVWLTDAELRDGHTKGIVGHADVSRVFRQSDHTDPGKSFPRAAFLARVRAITAPRMAAPMPSRSATRTPLATHTGSSRLIVTGRMDVATVRALQWWVGVKVDGDLGPATRKALQRRVGVRDDGDLGPVSWRAIQRLVGATADGTPGPQTYSAIQNFLNSKGA